MHLFRILMTLLLVVTVACQGPHEQSSMHEALRPYMNQPGAEPAGGMPWPSISPLTTAAFWLAQYELAFLRRHAFDCWSGRGASLMPIHETRRALV